MRQSIVGEWRISQKPALVLAMIGGASTALVAYVPKDLEFIRIVALAFGMFAVGMLASQHAAIWEPSQTKGK